MVSGKEKRVFSWFFLLYVFTIANGQDYKSVRLLNIEGLATEYTVHDDGSIVIDYRLPELQFRHVKNENGVFYRLSAPGHINSSEPGKPELPVFNRMIALPDNPEFNIRISAVRTEKIRPSGKKITGILYPAQESEVKRESQQKPVFRLDRETYSRKGLIGSDTVSIIPLGKARNTPIGNIQISPVHYNPSSNTLEVITSMKVEITFSEPLSAKSSVSHSSAFTETMNQSILNFPREVIPDYTDKPVRMIILTDTAFRKQIEPLVKWKKQKGFIVTTLFRGTKFAGNTVNELKNSLTQIYNSATTDAPAPDYLLIIGDVDHIPCYGTGTSSNYTDMYYGEFTGGGDFIPEMYVGRLPAKDTSEVRSVVNKIIQYEKYSFSGTNTYHSRALATTGYDAENATFMNGQVRYLVSNYLTAANNIDESHFYHYSGADPDLYLKTLKDSVIRIINNGTSFVNYSGHGDETGWLHIDLKVADTTLLDNKDMYPVIISNACRTSAFNSATSFGSRLVMEKNRGAVGFIGCSNDSYWNEDYYWTVGLGQITDNPVYPGKGLGTFDRLFHTHNEYPSDWYFTLGQINYAGNLSVSSSTSLRKKYYWETYNVVGDPSMMPIIGSPEPFNVSLPDTLPNGIKSFQLTVEPFAYVAISHFDTLWDASFGGVSGSVSLNLPGISNDSCLVVITGQNRYPIIKTIYISSVGDEFLNLNFAEINDQYGNNNKKADFRETIFLSLNISNLGMSDAQNVSAMISTSSDWLTIENDSLFIGPMPGRSSVIISDKLLIRISEEVPDMGIAQLDVVIKSSESEKHYPVDMIVHSPNLQITGFVIDDTANGNGDHIADPGETFDLVFRVRNSGSSDATGDLSIFSAAAGMSIVDNSAPGRMLKWGQITEIPLTVQLSGELASGSYISLSSRLDSDPFLMSKDFSFRIGRVRESFEALSFSIFPWINRSTVPWTVTDANYYEGAVGAKSGAIAHASASVLMIKAWYAAPDTLKFWCRVSSEPTYDYMSFALNGKEILKKSGELAWTKIAIPVSAGLNKFEWVYRKDNSVSGGADCAWIDMIDFAVAGPVQYIRKDLQVARIVTPIERNHLGQGDLTVRLLNSGRDTINGFNLAYKVDNKPAVRQYFKEILIPGGDSVSVTFKTRADLSRYGLFQLSAFGYNNEDDYSGNDTLNIEIENTTITEALILYPNPVQDEFTVFINSRNNDRVKLTISNSAGRIVYSSERNILAGGNTISISDAKLVPSTYYLSIRGSMINKTVPFIKTK